MKWEQFEGKWEELRGRVKEKWGKFTDSDMAIIQGNRGKLLSTLRTRYRYSANRADKELNAFVKGCSCESEIGAKVPVS